MKICYFWSKPWPEAQELLMRYAPGAERIWTGDDDYQYWRETVARWGLDTLVTIEQDNGIHEEVIPQLEACQEPWCSFGYQIGSYICYTGGGCRKLSLEAQQRVTIDDIRGYPIGDIGECADCAALCWAHMDTRIMGALERAGYTVHKHEPQIRHLRME